MNYKEAQEIVTKMESLKTKFSRSVLCWQGNSDRCGFGHYPNSDERFNLMVAAFQELIAFRQEVGA